MRVRKIAVFAAFCVAAGSAWLLPGDAAGPTALLGIGAAAFLVVAAACRVAGSGRPSGQGRAGRLLLYGAGALGLPALLAQMAEDRVSAVLVVAAYAGVPVVVAVTEGIVGEAGLTSLVPAVAALGGALLLLPVALPASGDGWSGLGLAVLGAGCAGAFGVLCRREAAGGGWGVASWIAAGAGSLLGSAWLAYAVSDGGQAAPVGGEGLAVHGVLLVAESAAAVFLLQRLPPAAFASRFLFLPMVGFVEALVLLRPGVSLRSGAGAVLVLAGGVSLWRRLPAPGNLSMSLR